MARPRRQQKRNSTQALPRPTVPVEATAGAVDLVALLQARRDAMRRAWVAELSRRGLIRGLSPEEAEAESATVYDALLECLETGRYHSAQAYGQDMAERDVFRGIGAKQVIGRLLVLRDVCGRELHRAFRGQAGDLARALDVYEPVINRVLTIVAMAFLQEREQAVGRGREQLGALVEAGMVLTAERSLEAVLQRIVEVACRLLEARYGALGVLDAQGGLGQFITTGFSEEIKARIGHLPVGKGILGALGREGKPLRLLDLTQDPRAHGFPPDHPPMHSFLGVPIVSKGRLFGNLYLTEKQGAEEFSKEDEKLAVTLAAQAAIAIENASLYEEVQRSYDELKRSQHLLVRQEKLASLGRLAAGLAHELNNPLSSVAGFAEALTRRLTGGGAAGASDVAEVREYLTLIQDEVSRAATIVRRLLDFARQREPTFGLVDLQAVVGSAVGFVERQATLANQRIVVAPFPEGSLVHADAQMLQQVFLNLLTNALDAIEGGGEVRITARHVRGVGSVAEGKRGRGVEEPRGRGAGGSDSTPGAPLLPGYPLGASAPMRFIEVTVSDSGTGIAPENLARVFDPFFTTKEVGKGTGLGLAICQSIIEQHRGSIEVQSQGPGMGTAVTVSLPLAAGGQMVK